MSYLVTKHTSQSSMRKQGDLLGVFGVLLALVLAGSCISIIFFSYNTTKGVKEYTLESAAFFAEETASLFREQGAIIVTEQLFTKASHQALVMQSAMERVLLAAKTLSNAVTPLALAAEGSLSKRASAIELLRTTFTSVPELSSVFMRWEPNAFGSRDVLHKNKAGNTATGQFSPRFDKHEAAKNTLPTLYACERLALPSLPSPDEQGNSPKSLSVYEQARRMQKPFFTVIAPVDESPGAHWHVAVVVPIMHNRNFMGVAGASYTTHKLAALLAKLNKVEFTGLGEAAIVSETGIIIASSDNSTQTGTLLSHKGPYAETLPENLLEKIAERATFQQNSETLLTFGIPVFPAEISGQASMLITLPLSVLFSNTKAIDSTIMAEMHFLESKLRKKTTEQFWQQSLVGGSLALLTIFAILLLRRTTTQQSRLRENESTLRGIIRNASTIIFVKDLERRYVQVNPSFERIVALAEAEILGKTDYDIFPKELADQFYENDTATIKSNSPLQWEQDVTGPEGTHTYITTKFPLHDGEGNTIGIGGIALDITTRMQAEKKQQSLKRYLNDIIDSIPSILIGVDMDMTITQWNSSAARFFAIPKEKAMGKTLEKVLPHFAEQTARVQETIQTLQPQPPQKKKFLHNGDTAIVIVSTFPLRSEQRAEAVLRLEDITKQTRIEEMMIQTEKMLSVGGLAAGMAHEINNPLGAILQGAQNIERRLSPQIQGNLAAAAEVGCDLDSVNKYLQSRKILLMLKGIREAGERAARIVQNMLNFSRKSESVRDTHDIKDIANKAIEIARSDFDLHKNYDIKQIAFVKLYPSMPVRAVCISTEIEQVLLNLFKNAAQAMAEEGTADPTITVSIQSDFSHATITVQDNGPGMDADTRKRIFEPFFTTKPPGSGTGLGLSVSYFIITQNHGGTFSVLSEVGQGTTFTISIPLEGYVPPSNI